MDEPNLAVEVGGIFMKNPVMTASGTFGYAQEFASLFDLNGLGGIIVKGLSLEPSGGNPPPRTIETCGGMLNAIGLENVGLEAFVQEKLPFLQTLETPIVLNIYGQEIRAYAELAERIQDLEGIAGIEINISCPNVKAGGITFGTDPNMAFEVVKAVREKTRLPLIAKLSPNVTDIKAIARSVEEAGADAVSLINTITGMAVDVATRRPVLANITGGLSGPAIKPIALRMVWEAAQAVHVPVIGIGGIMDATDALEFLIVGARAVQVGTANFVNPRATLEIVEGLRSYLVENNITDISHIIGSLRLEVG
ncbi:MAG: dihydroorotate dehydrogenase [Deltaproteobacteria bacterium]|nr:dihydroorotate dehydrogenase [Deltaproteobacteria bacterium]MBW2018424.1 dihydroorotate dehydrogenase [Deltaproteobacteria bacterium]MBW2073711.1 dihydroorotate dehydrogenase [Deltaproteobacteria bacterium]RLB83585.1 MAG: dihydroorotate dehydrogenase [Deltaproteobacteria bacterium]